MGETKKGFTELFNIGIITNSYSSNKLEFIESGNIRWLKLLKGGLKK